MVLFEQLYLLISSLNPLENTPKFMVKQELFGGTTDLYLYIIMDLNFLISVKFVQPISNRVKVNPLLTVYRIVLNIYWITQYL